MDRALSYSLAAHGDTAELWTAEMFLRLQWELIDPDDDMDTHGEHR